MVKKILFISLALFGLLFSTLTKECFADVSAQLQQADAYMKDKNYEQAEASYQQIVTDFPDSNDALEAQKQLTILYIKQDNQPRADEALQKLLADFYMHKGIAKTVNKVADHYRWSGKYEKARQLYQYVVNNWPQAEYAIWSQKSLAVSNIQLGDDPNTAAAIEKLLTNFSEHKQIANAVNMLADECTILKRYEKARELYQYVVDNRPDDEFAIWAQRSVTILNIKLGDDDAAAAVEKLLANFSEHKQIANAVNKVADHYGWSGQYEEARRLYQHVVDNWPQAEYAMWSQKSLAASNIALGNDPNAAAAIEKLLTNFSEHKQIAEAVNMLADKYTILKRYEKARRLYQYVVDNRPESKQAIWAQRGVAISSIKLIDDDDAAAAVEKLLANFSEHKQIAEAVNKVADHYRWSGKYEEARRLYQYVVDNCPDAEYVMWSQKSLAASNIALGDDPNAAAAIEKLLTNFSGHKHIANAVNMLADECTILNRYEKARELYQYVIDHWPDDEYAMRSEIEMAETNVLSLIESGDDPNAQAALDNLIADFNDHPDLPRVISNIEEGYYKRILAAETWVRENYLHPIEIWQKVMKKFPDFFHNDPDIYYFIADCYRQLGEYEKAVEYYGIVAANWTQNGYAVLSNVAVPRAEDDDASGDYEALHETIDRLIADFNDHPGLAGVVTRSGHGYRRRANDARRKGLSIEAKVNNFKAVALYDRVINEFASSPFVASSYFFSALAYRDLGQWQDVLDCCNRLLDNWPQYKYAAWARRLAQGCSGRLAEQVQ